MRFSIIFPTRDRCDLLRNLLDSISKTTDNFSEIEVLLAIDNDDARTHDYLTKRKDRWPFIKMFIVQRSWNFSRDYYSFLYKMSSGKWVMAANDDCIFETPHWDTLAYNVLKDRSNVVYAYIEDGIDGFRAKGHGEYCCFPMLGREGIEALGYFFPEDVPTWGADIIIKNLYDQIGPGANVKLPIKVMHYCPHNRTRDADPLHRRIAANQTTKYSVYPTYQQINKLLEAYQKSLATAGVK